MEGNPHHHRRTRLAKTRLKGTSCKTTNITKYTCDRCHESAYLTEGDPRTSSDWHQIKHTTADGVTQEALACTSCQQEFKKLAATQDAAYTAWLTEGKD